MWLSLTALLTTAAAHGLDANRLTLEVEDAVVRVTATPGLVAFGADDRNGDGLLDRTEVRAAREGMRAAFAGRFHLSDLAGADAVCEPASVSTVGDGAAHVRVSTRCVFPARPDAVVVAYALPADADVAVEAVRVWRIADSQWVPEGLVDRTLLPPAGGVTIVLGEAECAL